MTEHSTDPTTDHLAAAIAYAQQLRDDWQLPQLQAAAELSRRHRDKPTDEQIARALVRAAADPDIRKPAYVPAARYWNALDDAGRPWADDDPDKPKPQPHECRHCGQPGSTSKPPTFCPSCGASWDPVTPDGESVDDQHPGETQCTSCRRWQRGRFDYCAHCGAAMAYSRPAARPARPAAATPEQPELPIG